MATGSKSPFLQSPESSEERIGERAAALPLEQLSVSREANHRDDPNGSGAVGPAKEPSRGDEVASISSHPSRLRCSCGAS